MGRCRIQGWILIWSQPMVHVLLASVRLILASVIERVSKAEKEHEWGLHWHTQTQKIKSTRQLSFNRKKGSSFCFGLGFFVFFSVWMLITVPYSRDNERVLLPSIFQTKTWKIHEQGRPWCWASVFLSNISAPEVLGKVTQQYSSLKDACQLDLKGTGVL